ncbi:MAG: hypothetical protein M0Z95_20220 [Actinomycetota bacterium]|jgi:hypothetical protein|nr:hypothetical protein [Actinomycetota bacterium]
MFTTKTTTDTSTTMPTWPRGPFRKRLSAAIHVLRHGERPPVGPLPPLDPRIVAGINRHADFIADTYGDPLAGSLARDILTESAYVIVDTLGDPVVDEALRQAAEQEETADLLARGRSERR